MNKYKGILWVVRIFSFLILLGTLVLVVAPIILHLNKPELNLKVNILIKDRNRYEWLIKHEKINQSNFDEAELVFSDTQILENKYLEKVIHKTIIMENLFGDLNEQKAKSDQLSEFTGVEYLGYLGKTYRDLSDKTEVPSKLVQQYEELTGQKWSFSGEGIIIYSLDNLFVLLKGIDYEGSLMLETATKKIPYNGNFEITRGDLLTEQMAVFDLNLTAEGKEIFDKLNLQSIFPAAYTMNSSLYRVCYYAGDFATDISTITATYEFLPEIMKNKVIYDNQIDEQVYWQWFYPTVMEQVRDLQKNKSYFNEKLEVLNQFYVTNKLIYTKTSNGSDKEFFIKGINLGAALPGKAFTEFPQDKEIYIQWLTDMAEMNVNTVRIYTLFPSVFYEALYEFNKDREEPIYLLQEIWPEENPVNQNYLDPEYNEVYKKEIQNVVNAVHGNVNIAQRDYRAYGLYRFDVSDYLLGYLVGREMEPEEVHATDTLNEGYIYKGDYIYSGENASPTESWLAESCDFVLQVEADYNNKPLVGIVNWPTLDALSHDSEWNSAGDKLLQYNDSMVVDINHIDVNIQNISGFFGAYHIYPNYPDFMNYESQYANYSDEQGVFRYGGYLQEFMQQNTKYPAVVAEYGISTSMYTAHYNPDGYNHGGLSEKEQGDGIIRMTKAIRKEGYAGAIIFEWMDEWAKKTWTTEPYTIPFDRNVYWHNAMDPEQNYGIIAYKSDLNLLEDLTPAYISRDNSFTKGIMVGQDESYIYLDLEFSKKISDTQRFSIDISTDSEEIGMDNWEFRINYGSKSQILVNPGYNWVNGYFRAKKSEFTQYEQLLQLTNRENTSKDGSYVPPQYQNLSQLSTGSFDVAKNQIWIYQNHVIFRIPYGLIGISDPSSGTILSDENNLIPTGQNGINTKKISQINYRLVIDGKSYEFEQDLEFWNQPEVTPVKKQSFIMISDFFGEIK